MSKPYTLTTPCKDCPFRSDVPRYLHPGAAADIAAATVEDGNFYCHKTVDYTSAEESRSGAPSSRSRVCAGFLITMEKEGRANQPTRIAERIGIYDRSVLDMDSPTYPSMAEWVDSYRSNPHQSNIEGEAEYCDVALRGCVNPAGYRVQGKAQANPMPPVCTESCSTCDNYICDSCARGSQVNEDGDVLCALCA